MKLKRYLLLSIALFCAMSLSAQPSLVKWQTKVEHVSGDSYKVLFTATIEKGWHMYDMQAYDDGPNPTIFSFTPGTGVKLDGGVSSVEKPTRHMDKMFGMEVGYYENKVTFVQKIKLSAPKATLKANVEWSMCNDKSCAPPMDEDFSIEIVKAVK